MALSDMLNEAGLEIEAGADIYEESCLYSDDYIAWVRQLGELCKRAAGCIRDCEPLPPLPEIVSSHLGKRQRPASSRPQGTGPPRKRQRPTGTGR